MFLFQKKCIFEKVPQNDLRDMRTVQIKVSETDFQKYKLKSEIKFTDLVDLISREYARKALWECTEIAKQVGLSKMTMDEINAEIKAVRDAKNHS